MLTDLLSSVAEGGTILINEEDYLLARVEVEEKVMLAEVSKGYSGGFSSGEWPEIEGIILPDSEIHPGNNDSNARILLFSLPDDAELLMERIIRDGGVSEKTAVSCGVRVLEILRRVHDEGFRIGYLGPETVIVTGNGDYFILGGARGIPDVPFSPPEAIGKIPDDPRSDIFALGLLMFRIIAGSDNRKVQVDAWNRLSGRMLAILEKMVSPEVSDRFPNLTVLSAGLRSLQSIPQKVIPVKQIDWKCQLRKYRRIISWITAISVVTIVVYVLVFHDSDNDEPVEGNAIVSDSTVALQIAEQFPSGPDTAAVLPEYTVADTGNEPIVWISNGTGQPGHASDFREGPASDISAVYTSTGSLRRSSILLARRNDPHFPLSQQGRIYTLATELASSDSALSVRPVDITILLGDDLLDDSVPSGAVVTPSAPAGTLFVDIANHGVEGLFGGIGAATWTQSVLDGRSILIDGEEWYIEVVDFRNGDLLNNELGIPSDLDSTVFLYHLSIPVCVSAEAVIRNAILEDSTVSVHSAVMFPVPDIWVHLGY